MSFREYIRVRRDGDNPAGDFVRDARCDPTFPDAASWGELEDYLWERGANYRAVKAGRKVWDSYRSMLRRRASAA